MDGIHTECGDCLELMRGMPDGCVDLIVTDPPYEFADAGGGCFGTKARAYHDELTGINKGISNDYLEEMLRVLKSPNLYIWCNKAQIRQYLDFFEDAGCNSDILCWHKTNPTPLCGNNYVPDTEYCMFFRKGAKVYGTYETKSKYWVMPTNVEDKSKYGHPTVKPLGIIEKLIINSSLPGETVLDPFMGSGTTGVACIMHGRRFIGYELDPGYFDTAQRRLMDAVHDVRASRTLDSFI